MRKVAIRVLVMVVARQLLFSCSSEAALVLLANLTRSLLILMNVFFIFLLMVVDCPFAILVRIVVVSSFRDSASRRNSCSPVRQKDPLEFMIVMSQGLKP